MVQEGGRSGRAGRTALRNLDRQGRYRDPISLGGHSRRDSRARGTDGPHQYRRRCHRRQSGRGDETDGDGRWRAAIAAGGSRSAFAFAFNFDVNLNVKLNLTCRTHGAVCAGSVGAERSAKLSPSSAGWRTSIRSISRRSPAAGRVDGLRRRTSSATWSRGPARPKSRRRRRPFRLRLPGPLLVPLPLALPPRLG